jgi:hypothetical protein
MRPAPAKQSFTGGSDRHGGGDCHHSRLRFGYRINLGDLEAVDDRRCRLTCHPDSPEWLTSRLAMLSCEFDACEPPELLNIWRALGARLSRAAATG